MSSIVLATDLDPRFDRNKITPKVYSAVNDGTISPELAAHFALLGNGVQNCIVDLIYGRKTEAGTEVKSSIEGLSAQYELILAGERQKAKDFEDKYEMHAERSRRIAMEFKLYKVSKGDMA